jgi:hypothetical protein
MRDVKILLEANLILLAKIMQHVVFLLKNAPLFLAKSMRSAPVFASGPSAPTFGWRVGGLPPSS